MPGERGLGRTGSHEEIAHWNKSGRLNAGTYLLVIPGKATEMPGRRLSEGVSAQLQRARERSRETDPEKVGAEHQGRDLRKLPDSKASLSTPCTIGEIHVCDVRGGRTRNSQNSGRREAPQAADGTLRSSSPWVHLTPPPPRVAHRLPLGRPSPRGSGLLRAAGEGVPLCCRSRHVAWVPAAEGT